MSALSWGVQEATLIHCHGRIFALFQARRVRDESTETGPMRVIFGTSRMGRPHPAANFPFLDALLRFQVHPRTDGRHYLCSHWFHVQVFVRSVIHAAVDDWLFLARSPAVYFAHLRIVTGPSGRSIVRFIDRLELFVRHAGQDG